MESNLDIYSIKEKTLNDISNILINKRGYEVNNISCFAISGCINSICGGRKFLYPGQPSIVDYSKGMYNSSSVILINKWQRDLIETQYGIEGTLVSSPISYPIYRYIMNAQVYNLKTLSSSFNQNWGDYTFDYIDYDYKYNPPSENIIYS